MRFNLVEVEAEETNKAINILNILIIVVFIIIVGIFIVMFFSNRETEKVSPTNNKSVQTSIAEVQEQDKENKEEVKETNNVKDEEYNLPKMNKKTIKAIKEIYSQGDSEHKVAYLTFDDGPSKRITPQVLNILKENNIKATFFVLGTNVDINPDVLKEEYKQGHYIANHGYSHEYSKIYDKKENVLEEYNITETKIKKALGTEEYSSGLFRFPGGSVGGTYSKVKKEAIKLLEKNNIAYLDWNALTSDAVAGTDKAGLIKSLKETVKGKDSVVILMHDANNKIDTVETLPDIIKYLKKEGYQFKTIYDIINENI